jgi:hypothetical protein
MLLAAMPAREPSFAAVLSDVTRIKAPTGFEPPDRHQPIGVGTLWSVHRQRSPRQTVMASARRRCTRLMSKRQAVPADPRKAAVNRPGRSM